VNESEQPLEESLPEQEQPGPEPASVAGSPEDTISAVDETIEKATQDAAEAATEAQKAVRAAAEATGQAQPGTAPSEPAAETVQEPPIQPAPTRSPTITERLAEETEFDPAATNDDRLMAALAYASQLIIPILVPIILLVSETSKKRDFQRYHAVQSLAVGIVLWALELALGVLSSIAAATVIGILCLCFLIPAMIVVWLLPLYYGILAYNGKRFRIPGLTQFLEDQRWL
jgi:uncharacterized membrane protein